MCDLGSCITRWTRGGIYQPTSAERLDQAPKLDSCLGSGTVPVIAIPLAFRRAQTSSAVAGLKATSIPPGAGCRPYPQNRTLAFRSRCCESHRDDPRLRNGPIPLGQHRHLKHRDKLPRRCAWGRARPARSDELIRLPAERSRIPCRGRRPGRYRSRAACKSRTGTTGATSSNTIGVGILVLLDLGICAMPVE